MKFHFVGGWLRRSSGMFFKTAEAQLLRNFFSVPGFTLFLNHIFVPFREAALSPTRCVVSFVARKTCNCFSKQFMSFSQRQLFLLAVPGLRCCCCRCSRQLWRSFYFIFFRQVFKAISVLVKWKYVNYCNHFIPSHLKRTDLNESKS